MHTCWWIYTMPFNYLIHGNHPSQSSLVTLRWVSGLAGSFSSGWAMETKIYQHCVRPGSKSGWVFLSIAVRKYSFVLLRGARAAPGRDAATLGSARTAQHTLQTLHPLQPARTAFSVQSYLCYTGVTSSLGNGKQRKSNNGSRIRN